MRKKIWVVVSAAVFTLIILLGFRWAEREHYFDLTSVRIDNSFLVDSTEIAQVLEPCFGLSLLDFQTDSLLAEISEIPGVDSVALDIQLPNTIVLTFKVSKPAVVLVSTSLRLPVTTKGIALPLAWANPTLPEIQITGEPDSLSICSSINLLLKRELQGIVFQLSEDMVTIVDGDIQILLDPAHLDDSWLRWQAIRTLLTDRTDEVDLRFSDQAILRVSEES